MNLQVVAKDGESSRRQWLARAFWLASASVAAIVAAPLVGYFVGPLLRRREKPRVVLGRFEDFTPDRPQRIEFSLRVRDGWVTEEGRRAAWVVRRGDQVLVFDPLCTHLSCAYHWRAETKEFLCPCHNGLYDLDGRVVGGPPPRPLDTYAVTIENGLVYVLPAPQRRA
jgi:menaquinol-cytochrome c reductase iron-sulfur subunit